MGWIGVPVTIFALCIGSATAGDVTWASGNDANPAGSVVWDRAADPNAAWAQWDVFGYPYNVANAPDEGSSNAATAGTSAVHQTGTPTAFLIGPGVSGNIYSAAAATVYEVELVGFADATPGASESNILVLTSYTAGTAWDADSAILTYDDVGATAEVLSLGDYTVFSGAAGGGFGGTVEQHQWVYDITGVSGPLTWTGAAAGAHMSFQQFAADATVIDAALVPVPEPGALLPALAGLGLITTRRRSADLPARCRG